MLATIPSVVIGAKPRPSGAAIRGHAVRGSPTLGGSPPTVVASAAMVRACLQLATISPGFRHRGYDMSDALGLSIGTTNLVAIRDGRPPLTRRSILTLFNDRAPEVGAPGEYPNPDQPGLMLTSFVDRVGDPVAIVASDGSSHRAEYVLVDALDAMARAVGGGAARHHRGARTLEPRGRRRAARGAAHQAEPVPWRRCRRRSSRTRGGAGRAAHRAGTAAERDRRAVRLRRKPGPASRWPTQAPASPSSATRCATPSSPATSSTRRCSTTSSQASPTPTTPTRASTAAVGSLARLRDECRQAKERLSAETATVLAAELPGYTSDCPGDAVRTRAPDRPLRSAG